jgi:hypothetical protein
MVDDLPTNRLIRVGSGASVRRAVQEDQVPVERLAASVSNLIGRVAEPEIRAQLHALVPLLENLDAPPANPAARARLERAVDNAIASGDEAGLIAAMRELAGLDRAAVGSVSWSAASGG